MEADKLFKQLKEKITEYIANPDFDKLTRAYEYAKEAHGNQLRKSGEAFITHPLNVALILTEIELDLDAVVAAILHDVVEDTSCTYDDIRKEFNADVAELVDGVTKLGQISYTTKEEQQAESVRKMFLAMAKDIRVMLIKLADRLHNMRSMKFMPEDKQREKSCETLEIYAPLAHRLGISKIKWELEDLSLRYLDPVAYKEISDSVSEKRAERETTIQEIMKVFRSKLDELGIKSEIQGRAKHFYSIYRKMFTFNTPFEQIYDLTAVRIIVDTISDCYTVLGMVHEIYKPLPGRFKDYIAMPKKNMYQSLHSTMIGPNGKPFEVQIRTWEMHRIAEVGIAAHWKYKEGVLGKSDMDAKLAWIRQLLEIHNDYDDATEFIKSLKIDLFNDEVFVFSPKGDVINLPLGSTTIDFAYAIHSAIGNKMIGAKVGGKIVPLEYKLKNGDIVEIITSTVIHGPSRDWLKIVKTGQAKKKINDWLKKEHRDENILRGKEQFEHELKRLNISVADAMKLNWQEDVYKKHHFNTIDDLYSAVGYGTLPIAKVMSRIKNEYNKMHPTANETINVTKGSISSASSHGVVVKGIDNCLVKLARCCNPVRGDEILGYITRGRGVSVHRSDCSNVRSHNNKNAEDYARYIEVRWDSNAHEKFITDLQIVSNNRERLLLDVTNIVADMKLAIVGFNARIAKNELVIVNISVEINSKDQMNYLIKKFKNLQGVTSVARTRN